MSAKIIVQSLPNQGSKGSNRRRTIHSAFSVEGVGIHTNQMSKITFHPADSGTGILFKRKVNKEEKVVPASWKFVSDTSLSVSISKDDIKIQTIEHLMFGIYASGITDLTIELQGGVEIPILDGSAKPFIKAFEKAHLVEHKDQQDYIKISEEIFVGNETRYIKVKPHHSLSIDCTIDFPHPMLENLRVRHECTSSFLKNTVAPARTFGFLNQAEELQKKGYALGGSTENAVIFTEKSSLNPLRLPKEPVYHKILDIFGDLYLLGRPLKGLIEARCSGHNLDIQLAQKICEKYLTT